MREQQFLKQLFKLPRKFILFAEGIMVIMWAVIAFWGVIFIVKGVFDYSRLFPESSFYSLLFVVIGAFLLSTVRSSAYRVRKQGLTEIVIGFLNSRFLEIMTTVIFMLVIAVIVGLDIHFVLSDFLILPLSIGTSFSLIFGLFLSETLSMPFVPFIVLASTWFLQVFWMYVWARFVVKIIFIFRLKSSVD